MSSFLKKEISGGLMILLHWIKKRKAIFIDHITDQLMTDDVKKTLILRNYFNLNPFFTRLSGRVAVVMAINIFKVFATIQYPE